MVMWFVQIHLASCKSMAGNQQKEIKEDQSWFPALEAKLYFKIFKGKNNP